MIRYTDSIENITPQMLEGFFDGWIKKPSKETHLKVLEKSDFVVVAIDDSRNKAVGFISAISDEILFAHISLLEVLQEYRGKGIGTELVNRMLEKLKDLYAIGVTCDEQLASFYSHSGLTQGGVALGIWNYEKQSGNSS
jgi:GNAT superfamily N-acetyltransferase